MTCPNCGLINPPTAEHCDCGFEFDAPTANKSEGVEERGNEDRANGAGVDPVQAFVDRYCALPEPQQAPKVLRAFLKSPLAQDRNSVAWYFFARIAQDHPSLIREYEPLMRDIPEGRAALLLTLWQCGDDETKAFLEACRSESEFAPARDQIDHVLQNWKPGSVRPLEKPAENTADLDLLWYEFRATGNLAAVLRVIDVLEQPDIVRGKLETWLRGSPRADVINLCRELFRQTLILCDPESRELLSPQDIDCHCLMEELNISKPRFDLLSALLPFPTSEDAQRMLVKASAKWSLASHAQQFPQILELCRVESEKRDGRCRLALLEILARLALGKSDYETAFRSLMAAVTQDPKKREQQTEAAETVWERLEALSAERAEEMSAISQSPRDAAALCVSATEKAQTIRTKHVLRTAGHTDIGPGGTTWECEFERPGRFRVFQRMWLGGEVVGDEWITVAGVHFRGPVYVAGWNPSEAVNQAVVPDLYFRMLRKCKPKRFGLYDFGGRRYLKFEYKNAPRPDWTRSLRGRILSLARLPWYRCDAVAWVDAKNSRLVKVVVALNTPSNPDIPNEEVSLYCYFEEPLSIAAPPFSLVQKPA